MASPEKRKRWHAVIDRIAPERPTNGAEIGVWRAILSRELLEARPLLSLWLVDPYKTGVPGTDWAQSGSVMPAFPQEKYDEARKRALEVTLPWRERTTFIYEPSVLAARHVPDGSLDFAFIDGDHSYRGVCDDILAWLPKVRPGGWIGGHDWGKPQRGEVERAVRDTLPGSDIVLDAESTWFFTP